MMYSIVFIVLLALGGLNAAVTPNLKTVEMNEMFKRSDARLLGSSNVTEAEMDNLKFIARVFNGTDEGIGNGVIVNKYFVLTPTAVVSTYASNATSLHVRARCLESSPNCTGGQLRNVKNITSNSNCTPGGIVDCISLIRVCPSFPTGYFSFPAVANVAPFRNPNTTVNLYQYNNNNLTRGVKNVGELCECSEIVGWNITNHVCLNENPLVHGNSSDLNGVIVTDNSTSAFLGFLVVSQNSTGGAGEIVLNIGLAIYQTWIATTANITEFDYPV